MSAAPYLQTKLTVSDADLIAIGTALLNSIVVVQQLGHTSPASGLDYIGSLDAEKSEASLIVRDFIAWTSGRKNKSLGCEDRLTNFTRESGWYHHCLEAAFADFADLFPTSA